MPVGRLALLTALLFVAAAPVRAEERTVLPRGSTSRDPGCPLVVYRSEREITEKYQKGCPIEIKKSNLGLGGDMTGFAMQAAKDRACYCGGNALIVHYNSSEDDDSKDAVAQHVGRGTYRVSPYHSSETIRATTIYFDGKPPKPRYRAERSPLKPGFRDLEWGSPLDDRFVVDEGPDPWTGLQSLTRESDELKLGEIPVFRLRYLAAKTQLVGVRLSFDKPRWKEVKQILDGEWGPPDRCASEPSGCFWEMGGEPGRATTAMLAEGEAEVTLLIVNPATYLPARPAKASRVGL
jgi:hypothetical protein